ncbi:hypothetical protein TRFO_09704 [Tritrichomonas foetus]|uniref:Smr domain-containing protein n=1 Tax=Tritrichomonas foetus TaxID=1144522 RepID=A0A1J4JH63_9EUKA|nr:hypothetical protein TRFO_09704 [Tritrichomonas foetus]|eukprot:OHS96821.1 hypothetical protein TRFO_09704 [Tritrichomonas foetus]
MGCGPSQSSEAPAKKGKVKTRDVKIDIDDDDDGELNIPVSVSFDFHRVKYVDCENFIEYALNNKPKTICDQKLSQLIFISGKGHHSKEGKAVLKPMILEKCKDMKYKPQIDPKNEGQILVPVK